MHISLVIMFMEVIFTFAYLFPKMAETESQNALFMTMQLQLDLLQSSSSKDLA